MNLNAILTMASKMFPSANINGAVQKAQEMMNGTPDTLEGVSAAARKIGIDQSAINEIFRRYGGTMQAKALCSALGTTPEALKRDAEKIVGGSSGSSVNPKQNSTRFPRLK